MSTAVSNAPVDKSGASKRSIGIVGLVLIGAACYLALPTALIAGAGLAPSFLAWAMTGNRYDRRASSSALMTVLPLNLCGVMMVLIKLWSGGSSKEKALSLLSDPTNLMIMLAAGGFGWLLLYALPPVFAGMMRARLERRQETIKSEQDKLVDQWGTEITGR